VGSGVPLLQKSYNVLPTHYCTVPDFWDLVRPLLRRLSNWYHPYAYSTAVSYQTSRLWTVGIASVGTESVGIAWCTSPLQRQYLRVGIPKTLSLSM